MREEKSKNDMTLVRNLRFEVVPARGILDEARHLPQGSMATVTCTPSKGIDAMLKTADDLARFGFSVVPHIPARLVRDERHLEEVVERVKGHGVQDIFVIGGDSKEPIGLFSSARDLLEELHASGLAFRLERIGIAGYPEGHPFIDSETLWSELARKQEYADYIVTQMCFDAAAIIRWIEEARRRGVHLPVHIGIPGVIDAKKLLGLAAKIGVGDSLKFLGKAKGVLRGHYDPRELIEELAPHARDKRLGIVGLHIYTFNNIAALNEIAVT